MSPEEVVQELYKEESMGGLPEGLVRNLALLVLSTNVNTTREHVFYAWYMWMVTEDPTHKALVPYDELSRDRKLGMWHFHKAVNNVSSQVIENTRKKCYYGTQCGCISKCQDKE